MKEKSSTNLSRRKFISATSTVFAGVIVVPGHVIAGFGHVAPSDKLNIAGIGIGGKGKANLQNMVGQNMVAMCDVDWDYARGVFKTYPAAKKYKDFRVMLESQKDIDAVVIATPDHSHAIQAMTAMQLGKHVYCQKPLTHSVWESRQLTEAAKKYKVATQMGNEGHSGDEVRKVAELILSGVIGDVYEVHAVTNRPIWPQGLHRPSEVHKIPKTLDWDLFLGTARYRPYNEAYHPWSWRAWWDFGTGALGDMGCHVMDVPFYALDLKYPVKVQASSSVVNTESAPQASRVEYMFPKRKSRFNKDLPEVKLVWHDGGLLPTRPEELADGEEMGSWGNLNLYIGTKGKIISENYGAKFKILMDNPEGSNINIERVKDDPLGGGRHEMDWVRACKEGADSRVEACSNFNYSGPLNETVVMGNLAIRLQGLNREFDWDGNTMAIINIGENETLKLITTNEYKKVNKQPQFKTKYKEVNALGFAREMIKHNYRKGWSW
jgi:predicted dehydrogenase